MNQKQVLSDPCLGIVHDLVAVLGWAVDFDLGLGHDLPNHDLCCVLWNLGRWRSPVAGSLGKLNYLYAIQNFDIFE